MKYKLNTLEDKLRRKTRRIVLVHAVYGFLMAFLSMACLVYAIFILAYFAPQLIFFYIPAKFFITLGILIPLGAGLVAGYLERRDTLKLTMKIESQFPEWGDRLLTAMEFSGDRADKEKDPFSRMLIKSLEADVSRLMDQFNFSEVAPLKKLIAPALFLLICLATGTVHALIQQDFFKIAFHRWTRPSAHRNILPFWKQNEFEMKIIPGDIEVVRGSDLKIQALISGYRPKEVELHCKKANETAWQIYSMNLQPGGEYQAELTKIMAPYTYFVKVDNQESAVFQIKILEAIRVERVSWDIQYPLYTKMKPVTRQGWGGKITVPRGTKIHLEMAFNQAVKPGRLLDQGKQIFEFKPKKSKVLEADFEISRDFLLTPDVRSAVGSSKLEASSMWIQTLPDLPPYVEILEPQLQNYVFPTQEISFEISANDDYGLKAVDLVIHYHGKEERLQWLPAGKPTESIILKPVFKLEKYQLSPHDLVFAYLEVRDTFPGEDPAHAVKSPLFAFLIRDFVEQYKIHLPQSKTLSVRQHFEDILTEQEKIMNDTWDYISQPPREGPTGWESQATQEEKKS